MSGLPVLSLNMLRVPSVAAAMLLQFTNKRMARMMVRASRASNNSISTVIVLQCL